MPPANVISQEALLRRRTYNRRGALRESRVSSGEGLLRRESLGVPGVVDVRESDHDEKMAGVWAWEPRDPVFGERMEKVWILSGSPTRVADIIVGEGGMGS